MNEASFLDRLRARALGRLDRAELDALERELAADPELAALADDFRLVHALTAGDPLAQAEPRSTFEELERRLPSGRGRNLRRVAQAAGLLLCIGAAFAAGWLARKDTSPLYLRAIELNDTIASEPPDLPLQWADYDPRGESGVRFLGGLEEAELLARATERPLLVYGSYPGCPLCASLDAHVFSDPAVIELAERTVPVRVNLADLPEEEQQSFVRRGYPFLELWGPNRRTTHSLKRNPDPLVFVESLHDGIEKSDASGELPAWEDLRARARRFLDARTSEQAGDLAAAERGYRELLADPRSPGPISERATAGLRRLSRGARQGLLEARRLAADDPAAAQRVLEETLGRYARSSFEDDLRAALERFLRDGRFPLLAEVERSA